MDQAEQSTFLQHLLNDPIVQRLIDHLKSAGQSVDFNALLLAANQTALDKLGASASVQAIEIFVFSYVIQKLGEKVEGLEAGHPAHGCFWKIVKLAVEQLFKRHSAPPAQKDTFVSGSDYHTQG